MQEKKHLDTNIRSGENKRENEEERDGVNKEMRERFDSFFGFRIDGR